MSASAFDNIKEGDEFELVHKGFTRTDFVRYAGGGGDFNPIHHDESFAKMSGNETVFGMGMLTAGMLSRVPAKWFGAENVKSFGIRFKSRLWPGDNVTFKGVVNKVYEENGVKHVDMDLSAINQKEELLIQGFATCRPWNP
ncbi:MAG TPA: dihydroxy-acid dehydratase [Gammaproteobacteria bacterium]|nr:dihydroxy-acid dehydratase [Gammaproteobacteria bacterium]